MTRQVVAARWVEGTPRIRILYYDDGSVRFRLYAAPLVVSEMVIHGKQGQVSTITVSPRGGSR